MRNFIKLFLYRLSGKVGKAMSREVNSFVIGDASKCVGCRACEVACFKAHSNREESSKPIFVKGKRRDIITRIHVVKNEKFSVPVQCRQCEDAPCANACPVGAIKEKEHVLVVEEELCIGCKACVMACPFGAIEVKGKSEEVRKVAYKCDLCRNRDTKACVEICSKKALKLFDPVKERKQRNIDTVNNLIDD